MNYRTVRIFHCIFGILLLLTILFVLCWFEKMKTPQFSAESGFYDEEFFLEINGRGTIYYTLDSSIPDENSNIYTEPILICDASKNENKYSAIKDISLYANEYLLENKLIGNTVMSSGPRVTVDKATIVRAICVDNNGNSSEVVTKTYFVGYDDKYGYDEMNVLSLVTDPENLFDPRTGILVNGESFERYFTGVDPSVFRIAGARANYILAGPEWEKEANITFFDTEGGILCAGNYGIKLQGRGSKYHVSKNMNIYEREHLTDSYLDSKMLGYPYDIKSLNLFYGAVDNKIRNYIITELTSGLDFVTRGHVPYATFVDGEYWGNCYIVETFKDVFFQEHYDVLPDEVVMIKNNALEIGKETDHDEYLKLVSYVKSPHEDMDEAYNNLLELIDINSCIDYYATEIYLANTDWPIQNIALWKSRTDSDGRYSDGKWRWILFDMDAAAYPAQAESYQTARAVDADPIFGFLMESEDFQKAFEERLVFLAQNNFNPHNTEKVIEKYKMDMALPMLHEYERFYNDTCDEEYFCQFCDDIQTFFEQRYSFIMENYGEPNG